MKSMNFFQKVRDRKELIGREGGEGIKIFIMHEVDDFFSRGKDIEKN